MEFPLKEYLTQRKELVEQALDRMVPPESRQPRRLNQAIRYSLLGGGKRLRPILALASCEAVGGKLETALPFACALECIHTYSLIHDDLPAMDDDELRRGRPTCEPGGAAGRWRHGGDSGQDRPGHRTPSALGSQGAGGPGGPPLSARGGTPLPGCGTLITPPAVC